MESGMMAMSIAIKNAICLVDRGGRVVCMMMCDKETRQPETAMRFFRLPERWSEWGGLYALAGKAEIE